ncbi:AraC family transcriptional regulator [Phocaeicola sp. KGMB11183]|uniref:AraC family transcriptional regulator n=1 Tax=Phocaeicola acetigenes TaxID=3016083 RepID=A0ABT4PEU5_9BACT|nr:AraC family transcriptional regulator [Phocaeicola sp. KGMB11183]MCZ8371578.1 AraC family transcriptional regulator [Phocaeicola sp. KGMB11183]
MDTSLLSSLSGIYYEESNLDFLLPSPLYFNCGVQILCVHGNGVISTGAQCFHLQEMSEIIFWDGSIMQLLHSSDDFQVRMVLYPKRVFLQAAVSLDTTFFNYMREFPLYNHGQEKDAQSWEKVNLWLDMAKMLFTQPAGLFKERLELNFLQSMLMWIFSTIPDTYVSVARSYTRKQLLFHRFMHLIHEHALREHQVGFYADRLCISSRYLNEITVEYSKGKTPKELIDEQLTVEIKVQLNKLDLSVEEVAGICCFPDSSYLSRFFKKHTGITPKEFRNREKGKRLD